MEDVEVSCEVILKLILNQQDFKAWTWLKWLKCNCQWQKGSCKRDDKPAGSTQGEVCWAFSFSSKLSSIKLAAEGYVLVTGHTSQLGQLGPLLITSTLTVQQADGCLRTAAGAVSCPGVGLVSEFGYETCNCLTRQEESIQNCITSIPHLYGIDKNIQETGPFLCTRVGQGTSLPTMVIVKSGELVVEKLSTFY